MTFSQTNEISIRFIGNCGLSMTDGKTNIYVDFPYKSGAYNYSEYNPSELDSIKANPIFIFTHKHADHYSGKLVRKLSKKLDGQIYTPWKTKKLLKLDDQITDFKIEAFKTKHKYTLRHYSYLITWHDKKIFISGDTGNPETIGSLNNIDWTFAPVWLLTNAKDQGIKLGEISKMFAIYHIGPGDNITTDNPKIKLLNKQGEVVNIEY